MAYLTSCGWQIEAHRFRMGRHDVDLVARRGVVAFVEVKTRGTAGFGAPLESVGWRKRRTIARAAEGWRQARPPGDEYRFDVVAVRVDGGRYGVEHMADAWRLEGSAVTQNRSQLNS